MTNERTIRDGEEHAARASAAAVLIGLGCLAASSAIAVYALGSARGWWEGRSCALASCGAEDIDLAWYGAVVVAAGLAGLTAVWTWQMLRSRMGDR